MKLSRMLIVFVSVVSLLGPAVPAANAASQRISVMTQNVYQGTEFGNTLVAANLQEFLAGAAADYTNMVATNFPERADAMAAEIAQAGPALVGLQEVALWQTMPLDAYGNPAGPWSVSYDFLQILLDRLAAHGAHYAAVTQRTNFTLSGAGLFSTGLMALYFTEQTALLARTDLPAFQLQLSNVQGGGYQAYVPVPTFSGSVPIGGGWLSVDVTSGGKTFRFITTHLTQITDTVGVQPEQMQELLAGPAATALPVVIAGDLNSTASDPASTEAAAAGFVDQWTVANGGDSGYTCCQVLPTIVNSNSSLYTRIDHVLARGAIAAQDAYRVGATRSARTPSGLWPSDHAGLIADLSIGK